MLKKKLSTRRAGVQNREIFFDFYGKFYVLRGTVNNEGNLFATINMYTFHSIRILAV
jgi:hypothetical protein